MRITDRQLFSVGQARVAAARERLELATGRAATGLAVIHPGDDPARAGLAVHARAELSRLKAIEQSVVRASDELTVADGALGEVAEIITRARERAVQLANATYGPSDRATAAEEIQGMVAEAVAHLNVRAGDRFLFGGFQDGAPPFDAAGNYLGDAQLRTVEVAPGVRQAASLRADVAVKGAGGGVDLFATLNALVSALQANDPAAIRGTLTGLDALTGQVATLRAQGGAAQHTFDAAASASQLAAAANAQTLSRLEDADPFDAATELALAERALDAALTATSRSFRLTLLDKL